MSGDKIVWEFYWDCGRMGDIEGIFIATQSEVDKAIGKYVDFGECLGKHSQICGTLKRKDLVMKTNDQDFIRKFEDILGKGYYSGHNPLALIKEQELHGE